MKKKILAVDDDPTILKLICSGLSQAGYEVVTTDDGAKVMGLLESAKPDLAILDIIMPQMDGTEVARQMREDPRYQNIPIIFLTVLCDKSHPKAHEEIFGKNAVLGKPFRMEELAEKAEEMLRG
ncbi:MAG: response regulator [Candidatus Omnitrophota bacterium]